MLYTHGVRCFTLCFSFLDSAKSTAVSFFGIAWISEVLETSDQRGQRICFSMCQWWRLARILISARSMRCFNPVRTRLVNIWSTIFLNMTSQGETA